MPKSIMDEENPIARSYEDDPPEPEINPNLKNPK
jgi:hypothetical protein